MGNVPVLQRFFRASSIVFQVFFRLFLYDVNVLKEYSRFATLISSFTIFSKVLKLIFLSHI